MRIKKIINQEILSWYNTKLWSSVGRISFEILGVKGLKLQDGDYIFRKETLSVRSPKYAGTAGYLQSLYENYDPPPAPRIGQPGRREEGDSEILL